MTIIQERTDAKNEAMETLKGLPMCYEVTEDKDTLVIEFPYPSLAVDGLRVDNTRAGIEQAIEMCEEAWQAFALKGL